jgi:hypothetical protein
VDTIPTWHISCQDCRRLRSSTINEGVLIDLGMEWVDEDEPESVFVGSIKNVWLECNANRPRFVASIHSCSQFDYKAILAYLKNVYQPKSLRYKYITETDLKGK